MTTHPPNANDQFTLHWVKAQPVISSYISASIRDYQIAEDLLQEVALSACKDFARYDAGRPFLPWAMSIARFRVIDHLRKQQRDKLVFDDETLGYLAEASVDIHDEIGERKDALKRCIKKLQPRGRRALAMRYQRNQSTDEIATQLGVSHGAVFVLLHRVRNALGQCIEKFISQSKGGAS